jgi:hypothetical protein
MYADVGHSAASNRDAWKYTYAGYDLKLHADKLVEYYTKMESKYRDLMSRLMQDRSVSTSSKRVEDCKRLIAEAGTQHEKCVVYSHEFGRNPNRDFQLSLADVVYFGIAGSRAGIGEGDDDDNFSVGSSPGSPM